MVLLHACRRAASASHDRAKIGNDRRRRHPVRRAILTCGCAIRRGAYQMVSAVSPQRYYYMSESVSISPNQRLSLEISIMSPPRAAIIFLLPMAGARVTGGGQYCALSVARQSTAYRASTEAPRRRVNKLLGATRENAHLAPREAMPKW